MFYAYAWCYPLVVAFSSLAVAEPLVYERFEALPSGSVEGGVTLSEDVVGHGGLEVANTRSGQFDGKAGTAINLGRARRIHSPDFTVEAFVKLDGPPSFDVIASCWNEKGGNRSWAFVILPYGALRFDVSMDGDFQPDNVLTTRPGFIRPGAWYHVAAVSQGDTSRIYVNGREVAVKTRAAKGIFANAAANLKIGGADQYAGAARSFSGKLDEVRITAAALSPAELLKTKEPMPEIAPPGPPQHYEMPFVAKTRHEAEAWQARARARLMELVARQVPRLSTKEVPLDVQLGPSQDKGEYTLHVMSFQGNNKQGQRWPGLLAIPKGDGPFPAILALHGHGGSAEAVFDTSPKNIYHGFADRFARGGYVVLAPSFTHQPYAANVLWDLFRCVEILAARPEVDAGRMGVAGLSMGGEWTMWIAACDPRLKAAVVSGWMCTTEGVFSVPNCECWQLPGLVELMDICEVHLVIAPRPVLFESAEFDSCFPIKYTREGFERIRAGYNIFGAEDAVTQDIWPAGHEWHGAKAYPFVDKILGGRAAASP